ncbi:MAG: hypothetical protein WC551_03335 [Patescibacteria group bacterium]
MKILKYILAAILAIIIGTACYVGYGFWKVTHGKQVDLGVKYTEQTYDDAVAKKAGVFVNDKGSLYLGSKFRTEGEQHIDQTFSSEEISAIQNYSNSTKGPFHDVQIKFLSNNQIEASGIVSDPRVPQTGPVYVKGTLWNTGPRSFDIAVSDLKVGDYVVPAPIVAQAKAEFIGYVNNILSGIDGLKVEKVEIKDGGVRFVGNIPKKVYGYDTDIVTK